jgi:hypothetical protein
LAALLTVCACAAEEQHRTDDVPFPGLTFHFSKQYLPLMRAAMDGPADKQTGITGKHWMSDTVTMILAHGHFITKKPIRTRKI